MQQPVLDKKPRYLDCNEIMARLSVGRTTAYAIIRSLPHLKFGGNIRVREDVFEEYIRRNTVKPPEYSEYKAAWRK